jgi:hypothetical protein
MANPSEKHQETSLKGHPLTFDPEAASADPGLPGFLARPEGTPVYYGFRILADVAVDGFQFGTISDFEAEEDPTAGDAFVVAPDASRAGLVWERASEPYVREIFPLEPDRWGVWAVGFPYPMRTRWDARRNLEAVLPLLKEQWERWRSRPTSAWESGSCGTPAMMKHWSVVGTACSPPEPDQVLEAVRQAGFSGASVADMNASPGCRISFALYYDPERAPLSVDLRWLNREERDVNTSTWEMAEEWISDPTTLQSIRCYADVCHHRNADPAAAKAAVDLLEAGCGGLGVFPWQMI